MSSTAFGPSESDSSYLFLGRIEDGLPCLPTESVGYRLLIVRVGEILIFYQRCRIRRSYTDQTPGSFVWGRYWALYILHMGQSSRGTTPSGLICSLFHADSRTWSLDARS